MAVISPAIDLRPTLGPARDQGPRPTCLAFAVSDGHAALRGPWTPLSCEFIFFHAQRRAGRTPTQGASLPAICTALLQDGQPVEAGWPYLPANPVSTAWSPPANIGVVHRRASTYGTATVSNIIIEIALGRPVIVITKLSPAFYRPTVDGVVSLSPGEVPDTKLRHAVLAVGHGTVDGHRAVLVRNSWGLDWGVGGHAWLTETFLAPSILGAAKLS